MGELAFPDVDLDSSPVPLPRLVEILRDRHNVVFDFDSDLGFLPGNRKIFGEFRVAPLTVFVDRSIEPWSHLFMFALAHELGHLVLHRQLIGVGRYISKEKRMVDSAEDLKYREMAEASDLDWVEWQANEFAAASLLPRILLIRKVIEIQEAHGVIKDLGSIFMDNQSRNLALAKAIVKRVSYTLSIPEKFVWRRLRFLGILVDRMKKSKDPGLPGIDSLFATDEG